MRDSGAMKVSEVVSGRLERCVWGGPGERTRPCAPEEWKEAAP